MKEEMIRILFRRLVEGDKTTLEETGRGWRSSGDSGVGGTTKGVKEPLISFLESFVVFSRSPLDVRLEINLVSAFSPHEKQRTFGQIYGNYLWDSVVRISSKTVLLVKAQISPMQSLVQSHFIGISTEKGHRIGSPTAHFYQFL